MPTPPRPSAAAATAAKLHDIPEIEPDDVHAADEELLSQAAPESLVPEPNLAASMGDIAASGALLGQGPDLSLFAVPTRTMTGHASAPPSVAPSSIAPTITDLEVISFAQQARRSQSTRLLLALVAVAIVGVGTGMAMQGTPTSAALEPPQAGVAAARLPAPGMQLDELQLDAPKPTAVASTAAQAETGAVVGQAPSAVATSIPQPTPAHKVLTHGQRQSPAIARPRTRPRDEAAESTGSHAAVEGGMSWLVRAQQQEAANESSRR